jgi:hypothetical protein
VYHAAAVLAIAAVAYIAARYRRNQSSAGRNADAKQVCGYEKSFHGMEFCAVKIRKNRPQTLQKLQNDKNLCKMTKTLNF